MFIPNFTLKNPREIFHITNISNLLSIAKRDLLSKSALHARTYAVGDECARCCVC